MNDFDFSDYSDRELARKWNYLDSCKCKPTAYVEQKALALSHELSLRGVIAWDAAGNITERTTT